MHVPRVLHTEPAITASAAIASAAAAAALDPAYRASARGHGLLGSLRQCSRFLPLLLWLPWRVLPRALCLRHSTSRVRGRLPGLCDAPLLRTRGRLSSAALAICTTARATLAALALAAALAAAPPAPAPAIAHALDPSDSHRVGCRALIIDG